MNGIIDVKIDTDNGNISPDLVVGDIVISKAATGRDTHTYRAVVNKVTSDTITLVTTTLIDCDKAKLWVRVGNVNDADRQAYIVMDSEGSDAPKIAMYDNVDDVDKIGSVDTLKLILGNLDNISVPEFVSMSGYGLYAENVYLKGDMILGDNSSISFNSVTDGVSNVTTITKNTVTTEYINTLNITALGAVVAGTFSLGNGKFEVDNNGILTAEDGIFSGSITGSNITGSVIQGGTFRTSAVNARVSINEGDNNGILIYDNNLERMSLNKNGDGAMIYRDTQGSEVLRIDDNFEIIPGGALYNGIKIQGSNSILLIGTSYVANDKIVSERMQCDNLSVKDPLAPFPLDYSNGVNGVIQDGATLKRYRFANGVLVQANY